MKILAAIFVYIVIFGANYLLHKEQLFVAMSNFADKCSKYKILYFIYMYLVPCQLIAVFAVAGLGLFVFCSPFIILVLFGYCVEYLTK
jgi:hypothetical protein